MAFLAAATLATGTAGPIVVSVDPAGPAAAAGLREGDVLTSWRADVPAGPEGADHVIATPFDLWAAEWLQAMPGPVSLGLLRDGMPLRVSLAGDEWGIVARADKRDAERVTASSGLARDVELPPSTRAWLATEAGARLDGAGRMEEADASWSEAMDAVGPEQRVLLLLARGRALRRDKATVAKAIAILEEAVRLADPGTLVHAIVNTELLVAGNRLGGAPGTAVMEKYVDVATRELAELAPGSLPHARALQELCNHRFNKGEFAGAEDACAAALAIRQSLVPGSLAVGQTLIWLGSTIRMRGRLDEADEIAASALAIERRLGPETVECAQALGLEAVIAEDRYELERASQRRLEAVAILERVAPRDWRLTTQYNGLGRIAELRGDYDAAEAWISKARALMVEIAPGGALGLVFLDTALARLALRRGDLDRAERDLDRAALSCDPDTRYAGEVLMSRALVAEARGDAALAESLARQALAIEERDAPGGVDAAFDLQILGRLAERSGDPLAAEDLYRRALEFRRRLEPGTQEEAESLHGLGVVARERGRLDDAEHLLREAADVMDRQAARLGGSDDMRLGFARLYAEFYADLVELLVERGDVRGAFAVLERSRGRQLLRLLAERDLTLDDEIPPVLAAQRRAITAEYRRARSALEELDPRKDEAAIANAAAHLRELRDRRAAIADAIREASPRVAAFTEPRPLDPEAAVASLEPGTVLLEYAVGRERMLLFVVDPAARPSIEAFPIAIGEADLTSRIDRWREHAEQTAPPSAFFAEARELYDLLLRPAQRHVAGARRLLVSADGPLHRLPFAALRDGGHYLAELRPFTLVHSATIHAQIAAWPRPGARAHDLVAFGAPTAASEPTLAGSRTEVERLAALFRDSRMLLGKQATKGRVKTEVRSARYVHFACHGRVDERLPLDSALVLGASPGDPGLLRAWEIFESVRLDADLVTLAACRSGRARPMRARGCWGSRAPFSTPARGRCSRRCGRPATSPRRRSWRTSIPD